MLMWLEVPAITHLRIMVATGSRESLQQASELLETLRQSAEALHNTYQIIEILVLQCLALEKLGRVDEALEFLQQAIKLAEPDGWVRPFIESGRPIAELLERLAVQKGVTNHVQLVLNRFPTHEELPADTAASASRTITDSKAGLAEPLTRREFDVLKLLAQRLQTKEIAARLFVSPETVKTHLKNLYQKLDVKNRREAAIKAADIVSRGRNTS
jgi:LuxR family maltose regulon positive regulatory protein